ncbi:formate dehydrogenase accessory sulfurtransferase FdhD [Candidatus Persebacteraceae bacterium Df01]|uniref:Formate dehydrogenase accessory sulfurtransferase FdhD n=1 Tax=Candidatus Doriopsillibacter californiensis TaxID=2970740 RepID=A0ABT7QMH1_9GAMM|nr:formate dehydrogenase accessory sulfurtransferase FdhD [Candidatus Persebacteraceae bacterium Df01]
MNINSISSKPSLSSAQIPAVIQVTAADESGGVRTVEITGEYPLTLYVDGREIVTLMTLGQMPEALSVGWLRNQRLVSSISDIEEVMVDWEVNSAAVYTRSGLVPLASKRTITSGCGQGTMFGDLLEEVQEVNFVRSHSLTATALAQLLEDIRNRDTVYKSAGAVHACALAFFDGIGCAIQIFVEDVGRHNAVDAIAGWMWINDVEGADCVFYTTGRLTSEMVVKCAQMKIPYLVSRSGLTRMGYEIAVATGLTMFGRAVNRRYLLFTGGKHFVPER